MGELLGKAQGGCTKACSEMHTFDPPCEQAIIQDEVYRCKHGNKIATHKASGTWLGHAPCWRCIFENRIFSNKKRV